MFAVMYPLNKSYKITTWKLIICAVVLTIAGIAGAYLMYFIEAGKFQGRSFFGAVFLPPIIMVITSAALKISSEAVLDLCAPAECIMLALLKIKCKIDGCCYGRIIHTAADETITRFPSQIVECINALTIMAVLIIMIRRGKQRGKIYPWYLIIYGVCRFVLNLLRETTPFVWILPAGNFWSIISVIAGAVWILFFNKKRSNQSMQ